MARPRFQKLDQATRQRILETAAEHFSANGFEGTSLNQLLALLGLSKGSFYYYFDDKADLFSTVADHVWRSVAPVEYPALEGLDAAAFWPNLESLMWEARARARESPWLAAFTQLMRTPPVGADLPEITRERFEELQRRQADLIRRGQEIGAVRTDLPADLLLVMLNGADEDGDRWIVDNWRRFDENEIERLSEAVIETLRRILEPRAGSR